MSGIVALLAREPGEAVPRMIRAMLDAMPHRGPDGEGAWSEGAIGLGHLLLATTPEAGLAPQPLVRGDHALVADCRLDNRIELARDLETGPAQEVSDAELLLAAYVRWGEECVRHLLGDFAFIVWDRARRRLFCARDHFGVKPLFFYRGSGLFAAATEIKALLALEQVPRVPDEQMIADHLQGSFEDRERTYWQGIARLPAASSMTVNAVGEIGRRRYWELDPGREIRLGSDREYAEALRELFLRAVERRLRARGTVGSALSGGLDSTSVACTAAHLLQARGQRLLHTFSWVFDSLPEVDERKWILPALEGGMFEPHFLAGDDLDPVGECLRRLIFYEDGAFYAPNLFLHWAMYEQAAASGVRVFLDGLDGDSTLSHGIHYPHELLSRGHPLRAWAEVRALAARRARSPLAVARTMGLHTGLRRRARRLLDRSATANRAYRGQFGILSGELAQRMNAQRSGRKERPPLGFLSTERDAHHRQISWPLHTAFLETADRAAAPHGIEPRYPFYDVELAEFCLALPGDQKLRAGWTRWVMRRAMEGILPSAVQWRPGKSDLHPVLRRGLSRFGASRVEQLLSQPERVAGYVDLDVVRARWRSFDDASSEGVMAIWLPLVLDEALRAWSDGRAAAGARIPG